MVINLRPSPSPSPSSSTERLPDEETPLLAELPGDEPPKPNEHPAELPGESGGEQTVIVDEPSNRKLAIVLGSIYVGVFLGALDSTIIATLAVPISSSFNSQSLLSWLASAYLIANAACQPLSGRLTDIFGRGTGLVFSNIFFAAGNLICGLAKSEWVMIFGRVISGMGGGGLMAISTFVGSDLVPLRKRGLIQGLGNVVYGSGAGLGAIFGGWVNDTWGWRVAFLCQVPFVIVSAIVVYFVVNIPPKQSDKSRISRIDFLGAGTLVLTLVLLLLGLNSGGNIVPWNHPLVIVSLSLSVVALTTFIWIEANYAKEPVIPVRLLLNRTVAASCLTNWFLTMALFMVVFYIPVYFQVRGYSTTQAGARLIPQSLGTSIGSLSSGYIMNKTGKYKVLGLTVITTMVLGIGLLNILTLHTPDWPVFIFMFMNGAGYGSMLTVCLLAVISAVDHEHQAVVTSATYAFRSTGSSIGITIASAVFQNVLKIELWQKFGGLEGAAEEIGRIRDNFEELKHLPNGWKAGVLDSYMDSLRAVFLTATAVGFLGLVAAAFMREHVLHSTLARK